mmetsp:Transcript_84821/g.238742  ORF Transcript_84821/g.238742 Transcript_84821/m.238742 type:complete len:278 (+) Transcript_84821:84-917(+)
MDVQAHVDPPSSDEVVLPVLAIRRSWPRQRGQRGLRIVFAIDPGRVERRHIFAKASQLACRRWRPAERRPQLTRGRLGRGRRGRRPGGTLLEHGLDKHERRHKHRLVQLGRGHTHFDRGQGLHIHGHLLALPRGRRPHGRRTPAGGGPAPTGPKKCGAKHGCAVEQAASRGQIQVHGLQGLEDRRRIQLLSAARRKQRGRRRRRRHWRKRQGAIPERCGAEHALAEGERGWRELPPLWVRMLLPHQWQVCAAARERARMEPAPRHPLTEDPRNGGAR